MVNAVAAVIGDVGRIAGARLLYDVVTSLSSPLLSPDVRQLGEPKVQFVAAVQIP